MKLYNNFNWIPPKLAFELLIINIYTGSSCIKTSPDTQTIISLPLAPRTAPRKKCAFSLAREPTQHVIWKLLSNTLCLSGYPAGQFAVFMAPTEPRPIIISTRIAARGEIASHSGPLNKPYNNRQ